MPANPESRLEGAFSGAMSLPPEKRSAFLDAYCEGDTALRREVEELLAHHDESSQFLDRPALAQTSIRDALKASLSVSGRQVGPYVIEEEIGRGGMSVVYRGRRADGLYESEVAIKLLDRVHSSPVDEQRFRQEWRFLAGLEHPNIAKVIDAGVSEEGFSYLILEYIDGLPITAYCQKHSLPVAARLELFLEVCQAVSHAHNNLILHRDLKPSNILVTEGGVSKLIDFGIARPLTPNLDERLTAIGFEPMTLAYASPEQLLEGANLHPLPSSDVYALGVILFELLTGQKPIELPEPVSFAKAIELLTKAEPKRPSEYDRTLKGDLDIIVLKALHKDRERRFQSVEEFSSYIRLYVDHRPLPERAAGRWMYRAGKFVRRHRATVVSAALILATLVAGIVATAREARIAQRRFEDVRTMATSFLFDFDGALSQGVTPARRMVVAKGLEYLDKLSGENASDTRLMAEVADAYERLAEIQGNPLGSSLGEYNAAASSYEKGLAIRQKLSALHPDDPEIRRKLANSYIRVADTGYSKGDLKRAAEFYQKGLDTLGAASAARTGALEHQLVAQRGYSRLCSILLPTDHAAAMRNCQAAVEVSRKIVEQRPSDPAAKAKLATADGLMGNALRVEKKDRDAIQWFDAAIGEYREALGTEAGNVDWLQNLAASYTYRAGTWATLADLDQAARDFDLGASTIRRAVNADPQNVRVKLTWGTLLIRYASLLRKAQKPAEAHAAAAEGLEAFRQLADRPQPSPDDLNNYANFLLDETAGDLRNPQKALSYSRRAVAGSQQPSLVFLSTLTDAYEATGDLPNAIATAERALKLDAAPAGASALRAELEAKLTRFRAVTNPSAATPAKR